MDTGIKCVSILDRQDSGNLIDYFRPDADGHYRLPAITTSEKTAQNVADLIKLCSGDDSDEEAYKKTPGIAILDTGILIDHPVFKRYVNDYIDFTGEGINDLNGHGSLVTLQLLIGGDEVISYKELRLYICKILSSDGKGTADNIIKGLNWAASHDIRIINLSAGIDNRIWHGLRSCKGTCNVCQAAYELRKKNITIVAAAGNDGKTVCPAKVSLYYADSNVLSVGAIDSDTGQKANWSGEGQVYSPADVHMKGAVIINNSK